MSPAKHALLTSAVLLLLFATGLAQLGVQLKSPANLYDEGLVLLNAERILRGEVPYRDFWTLYSPGYFYLLAALFGVTGPSMLAARLFDTLLRFLLTVAVYALARRLTSPWVALLPWGFATLWLSTVGFYNYPAFPATAAILLVALLLAGYLSLDAPIPAAGPAPGKATAAQGKLWLLAAGLALGLTAALRHDFAGYAAVGAAVGVGLAELRLAALRGLPWPLRLRAAAQAVGIMAGGALALALPLYGYLLAASGWEALWSSLIVFPATTFRAVRHLPVPGPIPDLGRMTLGQWQDWVRLYLPLGTYVAGAIVSAHWLFGRRVYQRGMGDAGHQARLGGLILALTITGFGLLFKATSRYHELHALPATIVGLVVGAALAYRVPRRLWRALPFSVGLAGLAFLLMYGPYVSHFTEMRRRTGQFSVTGCYSRLQRAGCIPLNQDQERAIEYIRAHTPPGEPIFVGNTRHDLIFVNDLLFYFLADRPSPTRYTELHPGLATTLPVQQAIAADLAAHNVQWVVTLAMWESREPNASAVSSGVTYLDRFIRHHYSSVMTFGSYQIWRRIASSKLNQGGKPPQGAVAAPPMARSCPC